MDLQLTTTLAGITAGYRNSRRPCGVTISDGARHADGWRNGPAKLNEAKGNLEQAAKILRSSRTMERSINEGRRCSPNWTRHWTILRNPAAAGQPRGSRSSRICAPQSSFSSAIDKPLRILCAAPHEGKESAMRLYSDASRLELVRFDVEELPREQRSTTELPPDDSGRPVPAALLTRVADGLPIIKRQPRVSRTSLSTEPSWMSDRKCHLPRADGKPLNIKWKDVRIDDWPGVTDAAIMWPPPAR